MSSAQTREFVLEGIRTALGADSADKTRKQSVAKRLTSHRANLVPQRAKKSGRARLELFASMLESQGAKVSHAKKPGDIPEIVAVYLRDNNLPAEFRTGSDAQLAAIPWDKAPSLTRRQGRGQVCG